MSRLETPQTYIANILCTQFIALRFLFHCVHPLINYFRNAIFSMLLTFLFLLNFCVGITISLQFVLYFQADV